MWMVSVACLSIVAVLCVIGTLHPRYEDNILQRCGMGLLALSCAARGAESFLTQHVQPDSFLMHVAVTLIAVGAALKHSRNNKGH